MVAYKECELLKEQIKDFYNLQGRTSDSLTELFMLHDTHPITSRTLDLAAWGWITD
jgi:hypothetical protein